VSYASEDDDADDVDEWEAPQYPTTGSTTAEAAVHAPRGGRAGGAVRVVLSNGVVVKLHRAETRRASRAARPMEPSSATQDLVSAMLSHLEQSLLAEGRTRLQSSEAHKQRLQGVMGGYKGPGVRAETAEEQAKTNHIASLKARTVDAEQEASYLLCGLVAEKCYDRLAEAAFRTNAVQSSILDRRDTQGASYQVRETTTHPPVHQAFPPTRTV
jgi:hypothetical protein